MQSGTNDGKNDSELGRVAAPKTRARAKKPSSPGKTSSLGVKGTAPLSKSAKAKQKSTVTDSYYGQMDGNVDGKIALAAYFLAEQRRFAPGHELEDWLIAESQIKSSTTNS